MTSRAPGLCQLWSLQCTPTACLHIPHHLAPDQQSTASPPSLKLPSHSSSMPKWFPNQCHKDSSASVPGWQQALQEGHSGLGVREAEGRTDGEQGHRRASGDHWESSVGVQTRVSEDTPPCPSLRRLLRNYQMSGVLPSPKLRDELKTPQGAFIASWPASLRLFVMVQVRLRLKWLSSHHECWGCRAGTENCLVSTCISQLGSKHSPEKRLLFQEKGHHF